MSDTVRNAIVKLSIQLQSPTLTVPGIDTAIKQQQELAKANEAVTRAQQAAVQAQRDAQANAELKARTAAIEAEQTKQANAASLEAAQATYKEAAAELQAAWAAEQKAKAEEREAQSAITVASNTAKIEGAYLKVATSAIGAARGAAFLAIGAGGSAEKLVSYGFAIQGAVDVAKAGVGVHKALAAAYATEAAACGAAAVSTSRLAAASKALAVVLNPVVIAVGLLYVIYNRLSAIYRHFIPSQDEVNKRLEEEKRLRDAANASLNEAQSRYEMIAAAKLEHIDLSRNEAEKLQQLTKFALGSEFIAPKEQLQAGRQALGILDSYSQKQQEQKRNALELVKLRERELNTARDALKVAQDKDQSERAHIGALTAGEQRKLGKLTDKLESGQQLSKKESLDLQKLGGDAGQKIGEKFLATMDGGLGQRLEKLAGDPVKKAQEEFERKQAAFNKTTGGKTADQAVQAINEFDETVAKSIDTVKETFRAKMDEFTDVILQQQLQQSRQQSAARAENAATGVK